MKTKFCFYLKRFKIYIGKTFRPYTKECRAVYMKSSKLPAVNDVFEQRMISLELNVNKSEN